MTLFRLALLLLALCTGLASAQNVSLHTNNIGKLSASARPLIIQQDIPARITVFARTATKAYDLSGMYVTWTLTDQRDNLFSWTRDGDVLDATNGHATASTIFTGLEPGTYLGRLSAYDATTTQLVTDISLNNITLIDYCPGCDTGPSITNNISLSSSTSLTNSEHSTIIINNPITTQAAPPEVDAIFTNWLASNSYVQAEADTLDTVAGRGATTTNDLRVRTIRLTATNIWEDIVIPAQGFNPPGNQLDAATLQLNGNSIVLEFPDNSDSVAGACLQMPHTWATNHNEPVHTHGHPLVTQAASGSVVFRVAWSYAPLFQMPQPWVTNVITNSIASFYGGTNGLFQLGVMVCTNPTPSGLLTMLLTRLASSDAGDTFEQPFHLLSLDGHYRVGGWFYELGL